MGRTSYPQAENLDDSIEVIGVINPDNIEDFKSLVRTDIRAAAAWQNWEQQTGYKPFLASLQTRRYDPPGANRGPGHWPFGERRGGGRLLDLHSGILSVTELRVGVTADYAGNVLVEGQSFRLRGADGLYDSLQRGLPFESVEFFTEQFGVPNSVQIHGMFGCVATLGEAEWTAILDYGMYLCQPYLALAISRGMYTLRDLNMETRFAGANAGPLFLEKQTWYNNFAQQAFQNQRAAF